MTERLTPFSNLTNEKAPVSQRTKSPERREPVISVTGHPWYHSPCCTVRYSHFARSAKTANRCPCNGGHPSEPTCPFSSAARGPVSEVLCTRLAPPGGSLYAEENRFFPVNAFALCSKWFHFSKTRRPCQAVLLTMKMKRFHINSSINFQNLRVDPIFVVLYHQLW